MENAGVLFQSACYTLIFLLCVAVFARVRSHRVRQIVLVVASFTLYLTWQPWFAAVLITSIVANFAIGRWLGRNQSWFPLSTGVVFNLGMLAVFQYVPELGNRLQFDALRPFTHLALPLGISFWTFQALSYLFDQYRGEDLNPSFLEFGLYMAFFPVTISGPICRMPDMLPQFRSQERTATRDIWDGFRRIAIGVLMMQLARLLNQGILAGDGIASGFDRVTEWSGLDVWCLAFGYGLQLFFDFAGYSHIAIGAAKALGVTVPENFARPFASTTPSIFWTRWHMSLSFWIRDYVFLPLATLRREVWWRHLTLIISMVLFGLWHKASLLFLIWGCYHGALLVMHRLVQQTERSFHWQPREKIWTPFSWFATAILISLGWIFFRANSLTQAVQMLSSVFAVRGYFSHMLSSTLYLLVACLAGGYRIAQFIGGMLDRHCGADTQPTLSGTAALLARWRWFWIPPLYALALLFVWLITHGQEAGAGQLLYRQF